MPHLRMKIWGQYSGENCALFEAGIVPQEIGQHRFLEAGRISTALPADLQAPARAKRIWD
jgi:hypothetical protein